MLVFGVPKVKKVFTCQLNNQIDCMRDVGKSQNFQLILFAI